MRLDYYSVLTLPYLLCISASKRSPHAESDSRKSGRANAGGTDSASTDADLLSSIPEELRYDSCLLITIDIS